MRPEWLVDDDAGLAHCLHGASGAAAQVLHAFLIGRLVVNEATVGQLPAEVAVLAGVQDERVPSDVHEGRRAVVPIRLFGSQLQVTEGLVEDSLRKFAGHLLVRFDASNQTLLKLGVDHGQVCKRDARRCHVGNVDVVSVHAHDSSFVRRWVALR